MKKVEINIEDTGKIAEKENENEEIKENEESGAPNEKEEPESKKTKKYRVLIGMIGKIRKGGEIELTDEEAKPLLKEEYIEEV